MSKKKAPTVDPFDHTVIIPGVPELPAEATLILPVNQPSPEMEVPREEPKPSKAKAIALWIAAALLIAGVLIQLTKLFLGSDATVPPAAATEAVADTVPPSLQAYVDAAKQGDPKAMRMLGASYTYGLGVRVNKAEGAAWYRKAADAGDKMAAQELQATGGR